MFNKQSRRAGQRWDISQTTNTIVANTLISSRTHIGPFESRATRATLWRHNINTKMHYLSIVIRPSFVPWNLSSPTACLHLVSFPNSLLCRTLIIGSLRGMRVTMMTMAMSNNIIGEQVHPCPTLQSALPHRVSSLWIETVEYAKNMRGDRFIGESE